MTALAHALVVGGSGMLAGFSKGLLAEARTVAIAARNEARIRAIDPRIIPVVCDYNREDECLAGIRSHCRVHGAPDLCVAWIHSRSPEFRRALAALVKERGHFVQVLGSATADPAHPERLAAYRAVSDGLAVETTLVVLGYVVESSGSRWLTDEEISSGVAEAVRSGAGLHVVGTVEPWSARP